MEVLTWPVHAKDPALYTRLLRRPQLTGEDRNLKFVVRTSFKSDSSEQLLDR